MRLMIATMAAVALATASAAPVARADEPTPQASEASARQLSLSRRYVELMMSDQLGGAIRQLISDESQADESVAGLPEEDRQFMIDLATELTTDLLPQMIDELVPVYARTFTEAELVALIDFYDTEMGRSIIDKTTVVLPEANRAVMSVMPQMLDKMAARLCAHYGCEPGELEDMQRQMRGEIALPARTK